METSDRRRSDSLLLLSAGLLSGFVIAGVVFTALHKADDSTAAKGDHVRAAAVASTPAPSAVLTPMAAQPASVLPSFSAQSYQQPVTAVPFATAAAAEYSGAPTVSSDSQSVITGGGESAGSNVVGMDVTESWSGSGAHYVSTKPIYDSNPNWTTTRNGLIGNPCVDPPSTRGRCQQ